MATYKVIQDIEAEDKLVGPFSLRQFIYAGVGAFCVYLSVLVVMKGVGWLAALFVPPALFCFFFAWPWSPDQPTEVWALARIGFYFKPRKRIWDQSGVKELVTITVPKKIEKVYTNGLSQTEVKSRLSALADTIDSRGWVVKNANVNLSPNTQYTHQTDSSDRLVGYEAIPQEVPNIDVQAADDIMDAQSNPVAQQFDQMISASTKAHREQLLNQLRAAGATIPQSPQQASTPQADYWFLHQNPVPNASDQPTSNVVFANPQVVQPGVAQPVTTTEPTAAEAALVEQLREQNDTQQDPYGHLKTIQPAEQGAPTASAPPTPPPAPVPASTDAAILNLANNNDLNVATLAREAYKARNPEMPDDEVVISLH